jgi:fused signal recognition particle receptor
LSQNDEKKAKPGFMRRWFAGTDPAEAEATAAPQPPEAPKAPEPMEVPPAVLEPPLAPPLLVEAAPPPQPKPSWLQRLRSGLARSSTSIGRAITDLFTKRKLDAASLDDLEDILIQADLGLAAAIRIRDAVARGRYEKSIDADEVKAVLAAEIERALTPVALPLAIDPAKRPFVILIVGVNGSGKTTTIGKLAAKFRLEGQTVLLAAGDTFRAAAIEQLRVWARRTASDLVEREQGADAAGLAFDALTQARAQKVDIVLMDTAGRLQNRAELMNELEKIVRVMKKVDPEAPHAVLLVLDATVGQNALSQVEIFGRTAGVTGLVMTKLDGTARGGILVAIAEKFGLPVHFIGVGEGVDDLEPFAARDFAEAIAGVERTESIQ